MIYLFLSVKGLERKSKEAVISSTLSSTRNIRDQFGSIRGNTRPKLVRLSNKYCIRNIQVYRNLFCIVYDIRPHKIYHLSNITDDMLYSEFKDFREKRGGCPLSRISHDHVEKVVEYLDNIAEEYGLLDPGINRSPPSYGVSILFSHFMSHTKLYETYLTKMETEDQEHACYKSFDSLWESLRPDLKVLKLRSEICGTLSRLQHLLNNSLVGQDNYRLLDEALKELINY